MNLSESIVNDMYQSNDGTNEWGGQYGSFDSLYPMTAPIEKSPPMPPCKARSYYDYYVSQFPVSMGLDPTPWQGQENSCACSYAKEAENRWFANQNYVDRMFGQPIDPVSTDDTPTFPIYQKQKGCGYCSELKEKGVLALRDNMYTVNGQEIDMRM